MGNTHGRMFALTLFTPIRRRWHPVLAVAKLTIRSRSASDSCTSATVAPGIADAHRLVRIACAFT